MEFRAEGRLGCPHDYDVFRGGLAPLLQRIHRSDRHVGKTPQRSVLPAEQQAELVELRRRLQSRHRARKPTKRPPVYETCYERRKPRMNLDSLTHTSGEWLRGSGPESDIVISSRIRLARNLAAFPFTNRASSDQKAEIEALLRERVAKLEMEPEARLPQRARPVVAGSPVPRRTPAHQPRAGRRRRAARRRPRPRRKRVSLMVNEEDHLRLQVMRSGFALDEAWQEIDRVDDLLEQRVTYAFSEEFGYLTACPTNVGTGMRASVMLHLPALELTKQIEKVFRALQKINLAVRGLYGEGSRASGDFYQISNQVTLGKSETTILTEIHEVIPQIITYERQARTSWLRENRQGLQDRVSRAYGTLCSATMMTSEETMELLSCVRLGINLHLLRRHHHSDGERAVHPHAAGPLAENRWARRWTARNATPLALAISAPVSAKPGPIRIDRRRWRLL